MTTSDTAPNRSLALGAGAELELSFTDLLANGQAVGRAGGVVIFCFGPLPGERARVQIAEVKPRYAVAEMIELVSRSADRAAPFCPVFGACGGCQLQHLSYAGQLAWKRDVVYNALLRIGGLDAAVSPAIGMREPRAYRNKMSLVVDRRATPPALGFYRQRSHDVVAIDGCPVVTPRLDTLLRALNAARESEPVQDALEEARHVVARDAGATGQVVLTVTTDRPSESVRRAAAALMEEMPALVGVANSFDLSGANAVLGRKHREVAGVPYIDEEIGGVTYRVSAGSFFQVNAEMVGRIFEFLRPNLPSAGDVVDLYCGVGTFALYFARCGRRVVGIEENARAVAEAAGNARRNGLEASVRFMRGRVEQMAATGELVEILRGARMAFVDPPRKGCDEAPLAAIAESRVRDLWYLSCDAATLARDLKFLVAKGYGLITVQPFDMFPQTGHVETLVHLEI